MKNCKKIVLVTDSFNSGGAQKQLVNLANGLAEKSNYTIKTVQYYDYNFFEDCLSEKIEIKKLLSKNKIVRIYKLIKFLNVEKPDMIISFLHGPNNYSSLYKLFFLRRKTFLIVGERNLNINKLKLKDFLIRFSHILADKIVCNSNAQKIKLRPYFKNKLTFIPNGTKVEGIPKKDNYPKKESYKYIVPARFATQKNPANLLLALARLDGIEIHWYGEIFYDDPVYEESMSIIKKYKLEDQFQILPPTSDIYNVLVQYDAMILPSFYEGCPNAVIDAMLCGLPILTSDVSDNRLYLDQQDQLLFDPHSVDDIVNKINAFRNLTAEEIKEIGNLNFQKSRIFFDRSVMVDSYISLFKNYTNR